jgi:ATP-dependent DNA helicase RecQ
MHPARRKLAGKDTASIFDQLEGVMFELRLGESGLDKPLSCTSAELARVVAQKPKSQATLADIIGDVKTSRFGAGFLAVLDG